MYFLQLTVSLDFLIFDQLEKLLVLMSRLPDNSSFAKGLEQFLIGIRKPTRLV
jgi:hypothetical protein